METDALYYAKLNIIIHVLENRSTIKQKIVMETIIAMEKENVWKCFGNIQDPDQDACLQTRQKNACQALMELSGIKLTEEMLNFTAN